MASPLIDSNIFEVNNEANELHEIGLKQELSQDFQSADLSFDQALNILSSTTESELPEPDRKVQTGRILRDKGFNFIRFGIEEHNLGLFSDGYDDLNKSDSKLHSASGSLLMYSGILARDEIRDFEQSISAERGATISLMARAVTAREVIFEVRNGKNEAERLYRKAHHNLTYGDNGYYRVSNAMVAARHEKINRQNTKMIQWLSKAVVGLGFTIFRDKKNLKPAVYTFGARLLDLSSKSKAENSLKAKP